MRFRRIVTALLATTGMLAVPLFASPVTRDQLVAMAGEKVDPAVMRAIVERDCVDFDIDAANAPELSKVLPAAVLEAAIACRKRVPSSPPAASRAASPATVSASPEAASSMAPAPTPDSPAATSSASVSSPPMAPASAELRVRAVFIGESAALRCVCTLDGHPMATLTKEAQGDFGQAVDRSKIKREGQFVQAGAGRHVVEFLCDPGAQEVKVDVDLAPGNRWTIEIGESALRRWKLRKIDKK